MILNDALFFLLITLHQTPVSRFCMQKLPEGVLRRLGLEQSKTRHLPLHLHVRQITLPGVRSHGDLTVSCPLPKFFTAALRKLQIELPEKP